MTGNAKEMKGTWVGTAREIMQGKRIGQWRAHWQELSGPWRRNDGKCKGNEGGIHGPGATHGIWTGTATIQRQWRGSAQNGEQREERGRQNTRGRRQDKGKRRKGRGQCRRTELKFWGGGGKLGAMNQSKYKQETACVEALSLRRRARCLALREPSAERSRRGAVQMSLELGKACARLCASKRSRCDAREDTSWARRTLEQIVRGGATMNPCNVRRLFEEGKGLMHDHFLKEWGKERAMNRSNVRVNFEEGGGKLGINLTYKPENACVEALSLGRHAGLSCARGTLCEVRARRSDVRTSLSSAKPLRRLCVSKCSCCGVRGATMKRCRCGGAQMCLALGEPSAEIARVEALSLWRRANVPKSRVLFFTNLARFSKRKPILARWCTKKDFSNLAI